MLQIVKAIYKNGAFVPTEKLDFPENAEIEIVIEKNGAKSDVDSAKIGDEQRKQAMNEFIERVGSREISNDAPKLTREKLYERR